MKQSSGGTPHASDSVEVGFAAAPSSDEPRSPIDQLIGLEYRLLDDAATIELDAGERHRNHVGIVQGGVLCTLLDTAIAVRLASALRAGESMTSAELKVNFLRSVRAGRLRATAHLLHRGSSTAVISGEVRDADDRLVAFATSTLLIFGEA